MTARINIGNGKKCKSPTLIIHPLSSSSESLTTTTIAAEVMSFLKNVLGSNKKVAQQKPLGDDAGKLDLHTLDFSAILIDLGQALPTLPEHQNLSQNRSRYRRILYRLVEMQLLLYRHLCHTQNGTGYGREHRFQTFIRR